MILLVITFDSLTAEKIDSAFDCSCSECVDGFSDTANSGDSSNGDSSSGSGDCTWWECS